MHLSPNVGAAAAPFPPGRTVPPSPAVVTAKGGDVATGAGGRDAVGDSRAGHRVRVGGLAAPCGYQ